MRFVENGPSIPDQLLIARDEGDVVFFCGSGVSRARAGLPDFFGLAEHVVSLLRTSAEDPAVRLLTEARLLDDRSGIEGIVSADRIFGLLERSFEGPDIEEAVARAIMPARDADLSAHQILLDLATTRDGKLRLVTTNFDRLFEKAAPKVKLWHSPRLPDPTRPGELDGIVYLHGRASKSYRHAEAEGFILSSSDFGRAYLSEGWATQFFRDVIKYSYVVFVGYSADDPPVRYLLEALNKSSDQSGRVFAFQAMSEKDTAASWRYKGVQPIMFSPEDNYAELWGTLEGWADRARDPDLWIQRTLQKGAKEPESLKPFERGQVAHIVSTIVGARALAQGETILSAKWLCVFDRARRYASPGYLNIGTPDRAYCDPFPLFHIDSDEVPPAVPEHEFFKRREVPTDAWDAFDTLALDHNNSRSIDAPRFRGNGAHRPQHLITRHGYLGEWLTKICDQPATVWWASHQGGLHPDIQGMIAHTARRRGEDIPAILRQAWQFLLNGWEADAARSEYTIYHIVAEAQVDGWSTRHVRAIAECIQPYITAHNQLIYGPLPPESLADISLGQLAPPRVKYPEVQKDFTVPDEHLRLFVQYIRECISLSQYMEGETGELTFDNFSIVPEELEAGETSYRRHTELGGLVTYFSHLFERLISLKPDAAKFEFGIWKQEPGAIFSKLILWGCSKKAIVQDDAVVAELLSISGHFFWEGGNRRDLLLTLAGRWNSIDPRHLRKLEAYILKGRPRWEHERRAGYPQRRASESLTMLIWLQNNECSLSERALDRLEKLKAIATDWRPEYAAHAAESMEGRSGWVKTDTNLFDLETHPLRLIVRRAAEISHAKQEFGKHYRPFRGLYEKRPAKAFAALLRAPVDSNIPVWAWEAFLTSDGRQSDGVRLSNYIANRLLLMGQPLFFEIVRYIAYWLETAGKKLNAEKRTYDLLFERIVSSLNSHPAAAKSSLTRSDGKINWAEAALNSPLGKLSRSLFSDARVENVDKGSRFPASWTHLAELVLYSGPEVNPTGAVNFGHHVNWLFHIDPEWTSTHVLPLFDSLDNNQRAAVWHGFLWRAATPQPALYPTMKCLMLKHAEDSDAVGETYKGTLFDLLYAGWGSVNPDTDEQYVSDGEFRSLISHTDNATRSHVIFTAERWAGTKKNGYGGKGLRLFKRLLREVWPRDKGSKSIRVSERLCEIAFAMGDQFPAFTKLILPHLTTGDSKDHLLVGVIHNDSELVASYPKIMLDILSKILPSSARQWPWDAEKIIDQIARADPELKRDERYMELMRIWNAR